MSLKGYQWYNEEGKCIMSFRFKDLQIDIWEDVSKDNYMAFIEYIRSRGFEPSSTDCHYHNIIGE